jgi:membrane-anchored glycerophosphoryl diester phosphodiesterase (GDPDase)
MALFVIGFIISLRLTLAFPATVMENLSAIEALKRSNFLTRGARLKIFLVLLVIYAAAYLAMLLLMGGMLFVVAIGLFAFSGTHMGLTSPVMVFLAILAGLGFLALMVLFMACSWAGFTTALGVIYNDQRRCLDQVQPSGAPA